MLKGTGITVVVAVFIWNTFGIALPEKPVSLCPINGTVHYLSTAAWYFYSPIESTGTICGKLYDSSGLKRSVFSSLRFAVWVLEGEEDHNEFRKALRVVGIVSTLCDNVTVFRSTFFLIHQEYKPNPKCFPESGTRWASVWYITHAICSHAVFTDFAYATCLL